MQKGELGLQAQDLTQAQQKTLPRLHHSPKLHQERLRLDIRKNSSMEKGLKPWKGLPWRNLEVSEGVTR